MQRFAANLTYLFTELPLLQRFAAARRAGFTGVEILFPYDVPVHDLAEAAKAEDLQFIMMNTPPPNWAGGPRGFAAEPENVLRFRRDFERALNIAKPLGVHYLSIMAGKAKGDHAYQTLVDNLKWATRFAPDMRLMIEPTNATDAPRCFLNDYNMAAEIIAEVGAPNLGLQFDAYHVQKAHDDVVGMWRKLSHLVFHVQIASCPDRHEPFMGDPDPDLFLKEIKSTQYQGWVGAEYLPRTTTAMGLDWFSKPLLIA